MTPERLQAIRERAEKATQGPWEAYNDNEGMEPQFMPLWCVANEEFHNPTNDDAQCFESTFYSGTEQDAQFIAHARQDIPDLLAYVAELQADNAHLKSELLAAIPSVLRECMQPPVDG